MQSNRLLAVVGPVGSGKVHMYCMCNWIEKIIGSLLKFSLPKFYLCKHFSAIMTIGPSQF